MARGQIKKIVLDKGFGFIATSDGRDFFFHRSSVEGSFDDLREGQTVEYEAGEGPKGPRAEAVRAVDE